MNVLIVSRSERARAWVRMALGPAWQAREAANGLEAIDIATEDAFDLVVADELTEPYGAFGLARELKILPVPPAVIVLLDRAQDGWLSRWSGADAWLVQPVDPFRLAECAREVIDRQYDAGADHVRGDEGGAVPVRAHAVAGTPYTEANTTDE